MNQRKSNGGSVSFGRVVAGSKRRGVMLLAAAAVSVASAAASAQNVYTWSTSVTSNAWLQSANWTGGPVDTFPGVGVNPSLLANGAVTDVAVIGSNSFSGSNLGLNMGTTTGNGLPGTNGSSGGTFELGAIVYTGANATAKDLTLGKSDTTAATSVLRLNGATHNVGGTGGSIANLVLAVGDGSNGNMTVTNIISGGSGAMSLMLGSATSAIYVTSGRSLALASAIAVTQAATGASIVKLGAGTLNFNSTTSFTGGVTAQAGTLNFTGLTTFGGGVTVANTGTLLQFNSASTNQTTGGFLVTGGTLTLNSATTAATGGLNVTGGLAQIQNAANLLQGGITASGTGSVSLTSSLQNFTGGVQIGGTAQVNISGATATFSGGVTVNSGNLIINSATQSFTGGVTINGGTAAISGTTSSFSGGITMTGGTLNLTTTTGSFSGGINVSGGVLTNSIGSASAAWTGGLTVSGTGTVRLQGANVMGPLASTPNNIVLNGGTIDQTGSSTTITLNNPVRINSSFAWGGSGNAGAARNLTLSGATILNGPSTITSVGTLGTLSLNGSIVNGVSAGSITKAGPGVLVLTGATSTFTGGVTLNAGTLLITPATGAVTFDPVTSNVVTGQLGTGTLTINGGTFGGSTGVDVGVNNVVVNSDFQLGITGNTGRFRFTAGAIDLAGGTRTLTLGRFGAIGNNHTSGNTAFGFVTATGALNPTVSNGTLRLVGGGPGAADYSGFAVFATLNFPGNAGLVIGNKVFTGFGTSFPFGINAALMPSVTVESGGIFSMTDGGVARNPQIYSLTGAGLVTNLLANATPATASSISTLNIAGTATTTFSGTIADGSDVAAGLGVAGVNGITAIATVGAGQLTLSNPANTFTGFVNLSGAGTIAVPSLDNTGAASPLGRGTGEQGVIFLRSGTLKLVNAAAVTTDRKLVLTSSGGSIDASGTAPVSFTNPTLQLGDTFARTYTFGAGDTVLTGVDTTGITVGYQVVGTGIAPGTTVTAVGSGTVTLSGGTVSAGTSQLAFVSTSTNERTFTLTGASTALNQFGSQLTDAVNGKVGLAKTGTGSWTLTSPALNTGTVNVSAGTLNLGTGATLASPNVIVGDAGTLDPTAAYPGGFLVDPGSVLTYNGAVVGPIINNGEIRVTSNSNTAIGNAITGTGTFTRPSGIGTVSVTGTASFNDVTISNGKAVFGSGVTVNVVNSAVFSNGTLDVSAMPGGLVVPVGSTLTMNGPITGNIAAAGTVQVTTSADRSYPANLSGAGTINKFDGGGTATFTGVNAGFTGNVNVSAGKLVLASSLPAAGAVSVSGPAVEIVADASAYASPAIHVRPLTVGSLSVGSNAQTGVSTLSVPSVNRATNRQALVVTGALTIANDGGSSLSGFVDLADNDMIIKGGAASEATIRSYVKSWLDSGVVKVGLGSTSASALTTLGVLSNNSGFGFPVTTTFDGFPADASDLLVKYTYLGDTDLNGLVDARDVGKVLNGWSNGLTGWGNGDTNYDGVIDGADYANVLAALTGQGAPLDGSPTGGGNAIPEPAALGLLAPALPLLARRRRSAK